MRVTGQCHCGAIRFAGEVDPDRVQICHCNDCQVLTGSAFRVAVAASAESFALLSGEPQVYLKTADNGSKRRHAFCGTCGTPVFRMPTDNNPTYALRLGNLDQRAELSRPFRQIWVKRRLPWTTEISGIAEVDGQPG